MSIDLPTPMTTMKRLEMPSPNMNVFFMENDILHNLDWQCDLKF